VSRPRVLIVDDDEQVCTVATRSLEGLAGCDTAHDVGQAVQALHRRSYDLVLVDVGLPGPSGMSLLDHLRRDWPQCAAVMLSGATDLSVANEALERGAVGYVVKPFRVRDLRIQVTAALAGARRSTNAARVSARARIVAQLTDRLDDGDDVACVVVDLDRVSLLNASYGVEAVDRLCACVEHRLGMFGGSLEMLGKLGPATFAASVTNREAHDLTRTAACLHRALVAPALIDGQRIPIAARLGFAGASPAETAESIVNLAERAATAARDCGQPFVVYDTDVHNTARVQQELLADVATAIHRGTLHVAYQPQFDLATRQCVGLEALARWRHPTCGDVPASVFIPLAEQMDLIDELGAHILRTACNDLAQLRHRHGSSTLRMSVNASTSELRDLDYPARLRTALDDAELPGSAVRLEITESLALDESDEVQQVLTETQQLGVELSVDDFGTGYSSFATLTRIPWTEIKLDRSLTTQCGNPAGQEMVRAIINFGTALDIDVIAEGIETHQDLDRLRALGCPYGQGFLLGRQRPLVAVTQEMLRAAA
jgi:EAL domain-containing protein (putative c-di-GMP-specific phosphodiesterase class I)/DNA-binding response OmpR family regulator